MRLHVSLCPNSGTLSIKVKLLSKDDSRIHMKILYNKNDEKEMKASLGLEPAHNRKKNAFLDGGVSTCSAIHADKYCFQNGQT